MPPFKSGPPSNLGSPVIQGSKALLSASQYYIWSSETVLMVRWIRNTFEFDQIYKQTENKMQIKAISSSK